MGVLYAIKHLLYAYLALIGLVLKRCSFGFDFDIRFTLLFVLSLIRVLQIV